MSRNYVEKVSSTDLDQTLVFHYSIPNVQEIGTGRLEDGSEVASDKWLITEPNVLFSKLNPRKATLCLAAPADMLTIASTEFVAMSTSALVDNRYLYYALSSGEVVSYLSSLATSATRSHQRVQPVDITAMGVPWPDTRKRNYIVEFLDRETAEIDTSIKDLESLLYLKEERFEATLKDEFDRYADSPASKLGYLIRKFETGTSVNAAPVPPALGTPGILSTSVVFGDELDPSAVKAVDPIEVPRLSCPIAQGTLLVSRMNTPDLVGRAVTVDVDLKDTYLPDRLWQISLDEPRYVYWWTRTQTYRDEVRLAAVGASSSMKTLSQKDFVSIAIPLISRDEMRRLVERLDDKARVLSELEESVKRAVSLARERRAALISAAVTGQLDVSTGKMVA